MPAWRALLGDRTIAFLTEPEPHRGTATQILPGVRRIVADNPGPMTAHGTNTYLLDDAEGGGVAVIDPGPPDESHLDDILRVAGAPISRIILTHGHVDHAGNAAALRERTGALTYGYMPSVMPNLVVDCPLVDGDRILDMEVLHTPGHAPDHLCFARPDGVTFSGDHVMAWSTTFVAVPAGRMDDFLNSLRKLIARRDHLFLPAHGPALPDPLPHMRMALEGRLKREAEILAALIERPWGVDELLAYIYPRVTHPRLIVAARRTLLAHLIKLEEERRVAQQDQTWVALSGTAS